MDKKLSLFDDRMNSTPSTQQVARIAASLRKHFVAHPGYDTTLRLFRELMDKRQAELDLGLFSEGRGVAVIGESGSGKTTAVRRILRRMDLSGAEPGELRWISIRVPTPATQKDLARAILQALDFPIMRDTTASRMWDLVAHHLQLRKCWLIHLDEGQELGGRSSETEKAAVINALKSLMQIPDWPVNLIISGTPELNGLLMQDPQLSRRCFIVRFPSVTEFDSCDEVRGLIAGYAGLADLPIAPDLADVEFVPRLIHAGREQFGIVVELIIGAITRALAMAERPSMPAIYAALAEDEARNDLIFDDVLKSLEANLKREDQLAIALNRTARSRTSGENLCVVLLTMLHPTQELEPPANPARFSQIGYGPTQPLVLLLQSLQFLKLVHTQPTILLAPAVIGLFDNADLPDRVKTGHPLPHQNLNLP